MRRSLGILVAGGLLLLASLAAAGSAAGATIATTTTCSNGVDDTPGLGLICEVTVLNRITGSGGTAKVTVRECHGAAGDPEAACTTKTTNLTGLVTHVTQCNNSTNGGGGTLRCKVTVINTSCGLRPRRRRTVDQCVGRRWHRQRLSTLPRDHDERDITQCNGSANGGTLVRLECTGERRKAVVASAPDQSVQRLDQRWRRARVCSASITNRRVAAASASTPTGPPSDAVATTGTLESGWPSVGLVGLVLIGLCAFAIDLRRRGAHSG